MAKSRNRVEYGGGVILGIGWIGAGRSLCGVSGERAPLEVDGKFFRIRGGRRMLGLVSFGPFPGGWPEDLAGELKRVRAAGFDGVRLYEFPERRFLDAAAEAGLLVLGGLRWASATDFLAGSATLARARAGLVDGLRGQGSHPALAGVLVANEVPPDLARWRGPKRTAERLS